MECGYSFLRIGEQKMNETENPSLENWAKLTIENTERTLTNSIFNAFLLNSKSFDIFSSWFLLITGAIFTLLVSNLEAIKHIVTPFTIILFFCLMIASAIFGVIAKYCSIMIEILYSIPKAIEKDFPRILDGFENEKEKIIEVAKQSKKQIEVNIDLKKVMQPFIEQFPKLLHRHFWKSFEEGKKDPLVNHKKATKYVLRHAFYATIQIILFIVALLIFMKNINL